jgi:glycosyltransferase involved in cell wall biosynthesis
VIRVAVVSPRYWPETRRGTERLAHDLVRGLARRAVAPRLVTSHAKPRPRRSVEDGVDVLRVPRLPEGRLDRRGFEQHLGHVPAAALALLAARPRDDLVHALHPASALAAPPGTPLVLGLMGLPDRVALVSRRKRLDVLLRALDRAGAVVVLSEAARTALRRWLAVDARVIAPGVDLARFAPGSAANRAPVPTVLCAADPREPRKRVGDLLAAFALVREQQPEARLVLDARRAAGDPARGVVAADLTDLPAAYRAAWVTALPAVDEAFGLVALESLACGTPVVAARSGALPELTDRLHAPGDVEGLAAELLRALADPGDPAEHRARAEPLSADRTAAAHHALYADLLGS